MLSHIGSSSADVKIAEIDPIPSMYRTGSRNYPVSDPKIIVVDLRQNAEGPDVLTTFNKDVVVGYVHGGSGIHDAIASASFHALCFEYDYPDITSLMLLKESKHMQPSIPVFMVTQQHSESLAVWALRTGVWDYFVKPVPYDDLNSCLESLSELPLSDANNSHREMLKHSHQLPSEARFRSDSANSEKVEFQFALEFIERNMAEKISEADVARECQLSTWQFSRKFKQCFGNTFQDYLQHRRIDEAVRLLKNPSASVTDVCYAVGFVDPSYFARVFRRYAGMSPSSYKMHLNEVHAALKNSN